MKKIVGICGSPRNEKNTEKILAIALDAIKEKDPDIQTELITLAGKKFSGCIACDFCRTEYTCALKDDLHPILESLKDPSIKGFIIASPVYMGGMTSQTKAFIDRTVLFRRNNFAFRNKLAAAISIGGSRNGGQELTQTSILHSLMIHDMIIIGDKAHFGASAWERVETGVLNDPLALEGLKNLGHKMVEVLDLMAD